MPALATDLKIYPISFEYILNHPEGKRLLEEYAKECAQPELGETCPQPSIYEAMEKSEALRVFGVFHGDRLIGFAALLLYVLPHYGKKITTTESIFVAAAERNTGAGTKLLQFIEHYAEQNDCAAVLYTAPAGSQFSRVLAAQSRYRHSNNVFIHKLR